MINLSMLAATLSISLLVLLSELPFKVIADCQPSGSLQCGHKIYPTYRCSPPITASTGATLTNNDFSQGGDPSECDGRYHDNSESIVALSTGWYNGGSNCGRSIRVNGNGRGVVARVVDECDSLHGCDSEHDGQPPCKSNIVDASDAVWNALGIDINLGEVGVTWTWA